MRSTLLCMSLLILGCNPDGAERFFNDDSPFTDDGSEGDADTDADTDDTDDTDVDTDTDTNPTVDPSCDETVTLSFSGYLGTTTGLPIGLNSDDIEGGNFTGRIEYNPCVADSSTSDDQRGTYVHLNSGDLLLSFAGISIRGSGQNIIDIENFSNDTFRFSDGPQVGDEGGVRVLKVGGQPDPTITVTLAITDSTGTSFEDDSLPTTFPAPLLDITGNSDTVHTFALNDEDGTILFRLESLEQL